MTMNNKRANAISGRRRAVRNALDQGEQKQTRPTQIHQGNRPKTKQVIGIGLTRETKLVVSNDD